MILRCIKQTEVIVATKVTKEEFMKYKKVQESGDFNMFDPNACAMTGLAKSTYIECIRNYDSLEAEYVA